MARARRSKRPPSGSFLPDDGAFPSLSLLTEKGERGEHAERIAGRGKGGRFRVDTIRNRDPLGALLTVGLEPENPETDPRDGWRYGEARDLADTADRIARGVAPTGALDAYGAALATLKPATARLRGTHGAAVRKRVYDLDGDDVDVERWRAGIPECMASARRRAAPVGVRIGVGLSQNHTGDAADFARVIGLAAGAADAFKRAGLGVEIVGCFPNDAGGDFRIPEVETLLLVPLSTPDRPVSALRLCALGYPGIQRCAFFYFKEKVYGAHGNLGTTIAPSGAVLKAARLDAFINHGWTTKDPKEQRDTLIGLVERAIASRSL